MLLKMYIERNRTFNLASRTQKPDSITFALKILPECETQQSSQQNQLVEPNTIIHNNPTFQISFYWLFVLRVNLRYSDLTGIFNVVT